MKMFSPRTLPAKLANCARSCGIFLLGTGDSCAKKPPLAMSLLCPVAAALSFSSMRKGGSPMMARS